jgi:hypothetical protein
MGDQHVSLRIRRLKLVVVTSAGEFGADIVFPDGLVLLQADNTSGKSTCVKAIIYGLGLERMFGPANQPPLTPAMLSLLEEDVQEHSVIESSVFLEIQNNQGETLTIRREVAGSQRDWRLVTVWEGAVLGSNGEQRAGRPYYVRDPGAATREDGFHTKLAHFIGWTLSDVLKYDGTVVPLYLECILPLFYIEQRHGWSSIQATTPRFFQIRDVDKKAIEFLLKLDACERDIERQRVLQEEAEIRNSWHLLQEEAELLANSYGGTVRNLPKEPVAKWPPEVAAFVELYQDDKPIVLADAIAQRTTELKRLEEEVIPTAEQALDENEAKLHAVYKRLSDSDLLAAELRDEIELEQADLGGFDTRLAALSEDLKKNQDLERLRSYGATSELHVTNGSCPTCHQSVSDSLLTQQDRTVVMTVAENIEYIKTQIQTFDRMRSQVARSLKAKQRRLEATQERAFEIRGQIRSLRRSLVEDGRLPSVAAIRQRVTLEEQVERLATFAERSAARIGSFEPLADTWRAVQARKRTLAADVLTDADKAKLQNLQQLFVSLEGLFGFDSFPTDKLSISRDNYRPTREGFDVVYDVSASDNIRTICAYVVALLEFARSAATNHPGLLILDEPRQQNLAWSDFDKVLVRAGGANSANQQVIVATSDSVDRVREIQRQTGCHCITFTGKILKRRP